VTSPSAVARFVSQVDELSFDHLRDPEMLPVRLAMGLAQTLPIDGAGISVLSELRVPLGASDEQSATVERLQTTIGEGPCLSAYAVAQPVVAHQHDVAARWPMFYDVLVTETAFRSVASVPLYSNESRLGAIDLYWTAATVPADATAIEDAARVADFVALVLSSGPEKVSRMTGAPAPAWIDATPVKSRMKVWQAIGVLVAAREFSNRDALALLRAAAYSSHRTLDDVAADLVADRLQVTDITG
jgi:hypothetical protein